jgi:hypothetical protein
MVSEYQKNQLNKTADKIIEYMWSECGEDHRLFDLLMQKVRYRSRKKIAHDKTISSRKPLYKEPKVVEAEWELKSLVEKL